MTKRRYYPIGEHQLTLAEARTVLLIITGMPRKKAAELLGIQLSTLNQRMRYIYAKLQVHSVGELIMLAVKNDCDDCGNINGEYLFDGYKGLPWQK